MLLARTHGAAKPVEATRVHDGGLFCAAQRKQALHDIICDTLVVDRSIDARPGHIVVALVDGEVIVKRYEMIGKRPYLCSGNSQYAPIPVADLDCQVWGVVRSVIHEYAV